MNLAGDADLIIGVDTHLDTHTAALCDARGRALSRLQVPATAAGYAQLLAWARSAAAGSRAVWAVEGTRHYGLGLARHLVSQGEQVSEIDASHHAGKRRAGKSDAIDAVRAARELLARPHPAQMRADGDREALRLLMTGRDNTIQSGKTARTALAAILVTAPAPLRERLRQLPRERRARECAALTCPEAADRQTRILHQTLIRLGQRIAALAETAADLEAQITESLRRWPRAWSPPRPASVRSVPPRSCCPGHMRAGFTARQPSPYCRAPHRSRSPPAAPAGTGSTAWATASSTAPSTSSPSPACGATRRHWPTSSAAAPKARQTKKSAAA